MRRLAGGSMMAAAFTLEQYKVRDRDLWLYDTFDGMPQPGIADVDYLGSAATKMWEKWQTGEESDCCRASLGEVRENLRSTGYPEERVRFVVGKVEETIPSAAPGQIALLRLDTDWYESTVHELKWLYPLLAPGGILILDDYGYWQGARQAVDEFLSGLGSLAPHVVRTDPSGRLAVRVR
jgi:O-methyltransferase